MKKAITIISSVETYQNLAVFNDIKDLNIAVREYKETYAKELNKNAVRVLDLLHRYSAKYKGVSFRTKNNIAKTLGISRRTVIRACQRLEILGIIKQLEMKRQSDMMQTSNAIVIQPIKNEVVTQEKPVISKKLSHQEDKCCRPLKQVPVISTKGRSKARPYINDNSSKQTEKPKASEPLTAEYVRSDIPSRFVDLASIVTNDAVEIEEFYRVSKQVTRHMVHYSADEKLEVSLLSFRQLIRNIKLGKEKIGNLFGYYNKVIHGVLDKRHDDIMMALA